MKKSELRQMIREVLKEELKTMSRKHTQIKESAETGEKIYDLVVNASREGSMRGYTVMRSYDDSDNLGTMDYEYRGTLSNIINKLNTIAKTHEFSFIFIYDGDTCVFEANDTDTDTDEEFNSPIIFTNTLGLKNEPFMANFTI
jgi:hypothetical protein